jgi:hypothetical protein
MLRRRVCFFVLILMVISACKRPSPATPKQLKQAKGQATHIVVQHVLIGFDGSTLKGNPDRNYLEAKALAKKILRRAVSGEDFQALVDEYSDGDKPGIFNMTNYGVSVGGGEVNRKDLVKGFGDAAFGLSKGAVTQTKFHVDISPSGFHIIKRLE